MVAPLSQNLSAIAQHHLSNDAFKNFIYIYWIVSCRQLLKVGKFEFLLNHGRRVGYGQQNLRYHVRRPASEDQIDCWHCEHLNSTGPKHPSWKLGNEKVIGKIGVAFTRSGTKTESQFERVSAAFRDRWRSMNLSLHAKEQPKQWTSTGEATPKKAKTVPSI